MIELHRPQAQQRFAMFFPKLRLLLVNAKFSLNSLQLLTGLMQVFLLKTNPVVENAALLLELQTLCIELPLEFLPLFAQLVLLIEFLLF